MIGLSSKVKYHMCCTLIDMRKGFNGLSGLVRNYLNQDPTTGDVFVFLNKPRTLLKLLYWDGDGFVIFYKRLERGTFDFLANDAVSRELKRTELILILEGVKLKDYKKKKRCLSAKIID
ncbi:MAG TPA: IS66 family insertion sequence element accessory protein TnpB [Anaerovoracaceae bacterium]|nr:IS66 family insertion sequence element accessory protein TnpB [Anaerovoracaceae bacterium]